jgi:4-amino-4-deoxychorismate lyase
VAQDGHFALSTVAFQDETKPWSVAIAPLRLASDDPWLRHKITWRAVYDAMRAKLPARVSEWLFFNERNELCEGTITNIFITQPSGKIVTPALSCGVLPGVFRQTLLTKGLCTE